MPSPSPSPSPSPFALGRISGSRDRDLTVDLDKLLTSKLLLCATSGGGKSWTLRRLLESTFGQVPHHVIDPEGEFHNLRDAGYAYILAGKGYDCPTDPDHAPQFARKVLELGASVVLDLFELDRQRRIDFVAGYLQGLIDAPRSLWQRALIVIDEAHSFAPEKGEEDGHDVRACRSAVTALMSLGRKRGFCGVLATQRLAKLSKSASAEANNVLIGRTRQDVDSDRALKALGHNLKNTAVRQELRSLPPGRFYASGPALGDGEVCAVDVGAVRSQHPEAGVQKRAVSAAPAAIKEALAQLADLPRQAAEEARTVDELRARVRELERAIGLSLEPSVTDLERALAEREERIRALESLPAGVDVEAAVRMAVERLRKKVSDQLAREAEARTVAWQNLCDDAIEDGMKHAETITQPVIPACPRPPAPAPPVAPAPAPGGIPSGVRRVLEALAWFEVLGVHQPTKQQVAAASDYSMGGTFANLLGQGRTAGLIEYPQPGCVAATQAGKTVTSKERALPAGPRPQALQRYVLEKVTGPQSRLLRVLLEHGHPITREDLAARTHYSMGGTFANVVGSLHTLALVVYPVRGSVAAAPILLGGAR